MSETNTAQNSHRLDSSINKLKKRIVELDKSGISSDIIDDIRSGLDELVRIRDQDIKSKDITSQAVEYVNKVLDKTGTGRVEGVKIPHFVVPPNDKTISERYSMFPPIDKKAYEFFKMQECSLWSSNEITFMDDKYDYETKLTLEIQRLVDIVLAFFLPGDGLVNRNIIHRFLLECETAEETWMFISQLFIEVIHAETYGMMAYTLYDDAKIKELKEMADTSPYMKAKFDFMEKWMYSNNSASERFLAFSCVEGISFCVLFAIIFWLRKKNVMAMIIFANALISKDETLHRNQGGYMSQKKGGVSVERGMEIVMDLFKIEESFIDWLLPNPIDDLNAKDLKEFLKVVTDGCLYCNGLPTYFNVKCPFSWMEEISLIQKHNFFETKGAQYTRMSVKDAIDYEKRSGRKPAFDRSILQNPLSIKF